MDGNSKQILNDMVTNVVQRPEWDASGRERQMVTVYFTTLPSGFTGQVKMSVEEWADPTIKVQKVIEAAKSLDWRLEEMLTPAE